MSRFTVKTEAIKWLGAPGLWFADDIGITDLDYVSTTFPKGG